MITVEKRTEKPLCINDLDRGDTFRVPNTSQGQIYLYIKDKGEAPFAIELRSGKIMRYASEVSVQLINIKINWEDV